MRKSILLLASLAVAAALAAVPHYTNTFSSGGVTYSQLGGVKASNYVATAIDASLLAKTNSAKEVIAKSVADYVSRYGEHYLKDISQSTIRFYFQLMSDSATTPVLAAFDDGTICHFSKTGDDLWRFFALGSEYSVSSSGNVTTNSFASKQNVLTPSQKAVLNGGPYLPATPSEHSTGYFSVGLIETLDASTGTFGDSLQIGGKDVATVEQVELKADEVSPWVAHSTSQDIESVIGGRVVVLEKVDYMGVMFWATLSDLAVEGYTMQWNLSDSPASDEDMIVRFSNYYLRDNQSYGLTVSRGRVLRTGDPSVSAAFDAWRTNDNQVALGNSSTVSAAKGMAIGLKTTTGRTTIAAGSSSIAFGIGAQTAPAGAASVAIGANATASAASAVQIGAGNNTVASTLKFMGTTVIDADGRIPLSTHSAQVVDSISAVNAWQNYWSGDDVRLTVTNYYGSADIPSLYLEQKMPADETHDDSWFKIVWDERTRWNRFIATWDVFTNNVADRAWGVYDSSTGDYSPDGLLQLTQEQIMIASGMSWQKTVTSGGCAVWVLKSNTPTMLTGEDESGFFKIEDSDGNALFEIVKGDKRIVGATATDVSFSDGSLRVVYNSQSAEHPSLQVCDDLKTADWQEESALTIATVSWSGSSGEWIATITPVGARQSLFAKASYEAGGNTYIKNHVASSLDKVVVGGVEYSVSVETVNGKKLLVLQ